MPTRIKGPCTYPGCPNRAVARGRCEGHGGHTSSSDRGYGADWRVLRERFLKAHPYCECGEPATVAHHVYPVEDAPLLRLEWTNLRAMCRACHERLHGRQH